MSSDIFVSLVRKVRKSALVAVQGKFPIQTPYSERFDGAEALAGASSSDAKPVCTAISLLSDFGAAKVVLRFLALRRAFLEGGSGAVTSTWISSTIVSSRFRFLDGDTGGVMVPTPMAVEWRPMIAFGVSVTWIWVLGEIEEKFVGVAGQKRLGSGRFTVVVLR